MYVLLDDKVVCGGDHAFIEAEFFVGAVVAAKEREHSVEHGPHFVNLVGLVHSIICQMQEAAKGNEAIALHDTLKPGVHKIKLWLAT